MPSKKNKKTPKKIAAKKKLKKIPVKKKKKPKKNKIVKPDRIEDLAKQLPEDRYTLALKQKEELEKEKKINKPAYAKAPAGKEIKKYRASKSFMWFLVISVFLIILIGWIYSLRFTMNSDQADTSSFTENFTDSFADFKQSMLNFKNNIQKMENTNINANYNSNKKNINSISEEQLRQMEDKVFPKLKNNLNK